jgi:hypothetical protein
MTVVPMRLFFPVRTYSKISDRAVPITTRPERNISDLTMVRGHHKRLRKSRGFRLAWRKTWRMFAFLELFAKGAENRIVAARQTWRVALERH